MREYDIDAYTRKWRGCVGFFVDALGKLHQGMYDEFMHLSNKVIGANVSGPSKGLYALESEYEDRPVINLKYHPVDSGWYNIAPETGEKAFGLIVRRHHRTMHVGLCPTTHTCYMVRESGDHLVGLQHVFYLDYLTTPNYMQFDPAKPFGVLSRRLWWGNGRLMYLNQSIGMIRGTKLSLENKNFVSSVKPYVGDACQISY